LTYYLAVCGDGLLLGAEQCDDKLIPPSSGDGCSETCKVEPGWNCTHNFVTNRSVCLGMTFFYS
jgi:cysteine-rich repeat protein